jgi:anti-sigma regulatory factor (Ser/Thr protein kinase)
MEVSDAMALEIIESSQIGEARRKLLKFAHELGLGEKVENRLSIIGTELGTNLVKHSGSGGRLIIQGLTDGANFGIEIFSLDSGRGMNLEECLVDGYSSTGTLGTGLGAVKRMTDEFAGYSALGSGTSIQCTVWNEIPKKEKPVFSRSGLTVPYKNELLSGDKWYVADIPDGLYCVLIDGLGHGVEAAEASKLAIKRFKENLSLPPVAMIKAMHTALRGTRGAVGAVAKINTAAQTLNYCGLGNISGVLVTDGVHKHLVSMNGTLGYEARKTLEVNMPWLPGSMLIMHSDGLSSKTPDRISEVIDKDVPVIAAWLFQHFAKTTDDATILVVRQEKRR